MSERFIALCHHRWSVPVLAQLARGPGAKFVTLRHRLGVSRDSLRAALDDLMDQRLVRRNPGYGHPMRPEYLFTDAGEALAEPSDKLMTRISRARLEDVALRKWTMPALLVLRGGPRRFSELLARLPGVTPRALALTLRDLVEWTLADRMILDGYPPSSEYRLTPRGKRMAAGVGLLYDALPRT